MGIVDSVVCGSPDPHTHADRKSSHVQADSATLGETCGPAEAARSETGHNAQPDFLTQPAFTVFIA